MPDKHEVGGSSPLGPTSAKAQGALVHKQKIIEWSYQRESANGEKANPNNSAFCIMHFAFIMGV